jgi:glucose/arabinose dehydrogenase
MKLNRLFLVIHFLFLSAFLSAEDNSNLIFDNNMVVEVFASHLDSPRQLDESDDGWIFVGSLKGGKIFAIRDTDGNGKSDEKYTVAAGLKMPSGVSIFEGDLYFTEIDKVWKIEDIDKFLENHSGKLPEKTLVTNDLPDDEWHGWKWIMHDHLGQLYINVGAPCNVCIKDDKRYASILRLNNGSWDYVARGVRNSVGFDFHPVTKKLYFGDNGRDWLGDNSPSCELNKVDIEGSFYGFPYKHALNVIDPDFGNLESGFDFVDPIAELGAHVAPTGMAFYDGDMFAEFKNNIFITLHGSWNRSSKVGYKVIRVTLDEEGNFYTMEDFISGWLKNEKVIGRPAAPFVMRDGSILISDDKKNVIYRVSKKNA